MKKKILRSLIGTSLALLFSISIINADYGTNNKGWVIEIQPITYE